MIYTPLSNDFSRNDPSFKVKSIGSVSIHMFDMKIQILSNVIDTSKLRRNLISLCILNAQGSFFFFCEGGLLEDFEGALM